VESFTRLFMRMYELSIDRIVQLGAKLDPLSSLMESGVEFIAVDNLHATKLTIHVLAVMAEHESEMISQRTKDALSAPTPLDSSRWVTRARHDGRAFFIAWPFAVSSILFVGTQPLISSRNPCRLSRRDGTAYPLQRSLRPDIGCHDDIRSSRCS
jgi:hypothetical protein